MEHILRAQVIWLERVGGQRSFDAENPYDLAEALHLAWVAHIEEADLEEVISFHTSLGLRFDQARLDIIRHLINHGTYHRGQLRAMADMSGVADFPETDYIFYLREIRGS